MDARMKNFVRPESDSLHGLSVSLYLRDRMDRTCCLVGVRLQVVDRQGVYQLYNQYRPNLTTGLGDSLVSFSSLNEHSLARSGCCTTRNEYIL